MEPTHAWDLRHPALTRRLHAPWRGRVPPADAVRPLPPHGQGIPVASIQSCALHRRLPGRAWRNDRLSFAKTSARAQVIDLSAPIRTQSESMITLLLHLQTISMTMRYSHLAPDHLRAAVAVLDGVLFASQPTQTAAVSAQASTQERAELVGVSQKSL